MNTLHQQQHQETSVFRQDHWMLKPLQTEKIQALPQKSYKGAAKRKRQSPWLQTYY